MGSASLALVNRVIGLNRTFAVLANLFKRAIAGGGKQRRRLKPYRQQLRRRGGRSMLRILFARHVVLPNPLWWAVAAVIYPYRWARRRFFPYRMPEQFCQACGREMSDSALCAGCHAFGAAFQYLSTCQSLPRKHAIPVTDFPLNYPSSGGKSSMTIITLSKPA